MIVSKQQEAGKLLKSKVIIGFEDLHSIRIPSLFWRLPSFYVFGISCSPFLPLAPWSNSCRKWQGYHWRNAATLWKFWKEALGGPSDIWFINFMKMPGPFEVDSLLSKIVKPGELIFDISVSFFCSKRACSIFELQLGHFCVILGKLAVSTSAKQT